MRYTVMVVERATGKIVQEMHRQSYAAACRAMDNAVSDANPLVYKVSFIDNEDKGGRK